MVGTVVARRYSLLSKIGEGGCGEVFRARDSLTGEDVAIKLIRAESTRSRARREVAALRALRLPSVVHLRDEGVHGDSVFLVMDLVDGAPFPGAVGAPASWKQIRTTCLLLAEALARVHHAGIVHRDLKPTNVLVEGAGVPVMLDFGLARGDGVGETITQDRMVLGTPAYLAPETWSGHRSDARSDLYALGVMMFEALSGVVPHHDASGALVLTDRLTKPAPSLQAVAPSVPEPVCEIIERLLAPRAADRFADAGELAHAFIEQAFDDGWQLPDVGDDAQVERLCAAAAGRSPVDVGGPAGCGVARFLRRVERRLAGAGCDILWIERGRLPLESLLAVTGVQPGDSDSLTELVDRVGGALRARLEAGAVVFAGAPQDIDPWSRDVLEECRGAGALMRVAPPDASADVVLGAVPESDLVELFHGPDRVLHLREDAAHELWLRTEGMPDRVEAEVRSWLRSGVARVDGDRLRVERAAIDGLRSGVRAAPIRHWPVPVPSDLSAELVELLAWIHLAGGEVSFGVLHDVTQLSRWLLEARLGELECRGLVRRSIERWHAQCPPVPLRAWDDERRAEAHLALAGALPDNTIDRLVHLMFGGDAGAVATAAVAMAGQSANQGRLGEAVAVIEAALTVARGAHDLDAEDALLAELACHAVQDGAVQTLERALYEHDRAHTTSPTSARLRAVLRARLAAANGNLTRCLDELEDIGAFDRPELEALRQTCLFFAAQRGTDPRRDKILQAALAWAEASRLSGHEACCAEWRGLLEYQRGNYGRAAELQWKAAQAAAGDVVGQVRATLYGASAAMENCDWERAAQAATRARETAAQCRLPLYETRAEWILRTIAYRAGRATSADLELVEAVAQIGRVHHEGLIALTEAAVSWRAGDTELAVELCQRASGAFSVSGSPIALLLSESLLVALGRTDTRWPLGKMVHSAMTCRVSGIGVQALGLLSRAPAFDTEVDRETLPGHALDLAHTVLESRWSVRQDILSVRESLDMLGVPPSAQ